MIHNKLEGRLSKSLSNAIFSYFLDCAIDKGEDINIEHARKISVEIAINIITDKVLALDVINDEYLKLVKIK